MVWNEETIRHLRVLWTEGHSTAEIGRRLGVSKNAIVGKAHRLDLDARPSPIRRDASKPAAERPAPYPKFAGPTLPPLASSVIHTVPAREPAPPPLMAPAALPPAPDVQAANGPASNGHASIGPASNGAASNGPASNDQISNVQKLHVVPPGPAPVPPPAPVLVQPVRPMAAPPPPAPRRSAPACCWPIGEPGTKAFRFCDDLSLPGKPYCDEHAKLAYVRIRDRKEDAA
jgi:GcrA cell cycle regulator